MNLVTAGAVFDLLGRIQQESYQWRGMDASAAKILASGWVDPGDGGDDTGSRRSLGYSRGWNFQFTPDGAGKLAEMKIEAPGAGSFRGLGMLTGIDVDGGSTLRLIGAKLGMGPPDGGMCVIQWTQVDIIGPWSGGPNDILSLRK